jgi:hypothetical protein
VTEIKRDFYFIRDRLPLKWTRIGDDESEAKTAEILELKSLLLDFLNNLTFSHPNQKTLLSEVTQKCNAVFDQQKTQRGPSLDSELHDADYVDVTISTSGIGFLTAREMQEGTGIELRILLESVSTTVNVQMAIIDSKLSGDPENPGYWVRGRFLPNQQSAINMIMAHISQRQSDRLSEKQRLD